MDTIMFNTQDTTIGTRPTRSLADRTSKTATKLMASDAKLFGRPPVLPKMDGRGIVFDAFVSILLVPNPSHKGTSCCF
jgi:hypothetical protein